MKITEDLIIHFAGNASVVSNGRSLANKGSYVALSVNKDADLLFGLCQGSGKKPYACSVDYADKDKPIARCNCPSRQIPCKHAVGLLFCRLQNKIFTVAEVPEDIVGKRAKQKARAEKQADAAHQDKSAQQGESPQQGSRKSHAPLTKQKAEAARKKCQGQMVGIELAEKILHNIVRGGLHSIDRQNEKLYAEQVKELGNYYIGGIQATLTDLLASAAQGQKKQAFAQTFKQLSYAYALLQKAKAHTQNKIADYEAFPAVGSAALEGTLHSSIEEKMGYAWKLTELAEQGLLLKEARLLQLGFRVYDDAAKKESVDEGIWLSLTNGKIYLSKNFRPYKARKHIRADDSCFALLATPELFVYPGDQNPRVRWDAASLHDVTSSDLAEAQKAGRSDFPSVIKEVKSQLRAPLADKNPLFALKVTRMGQDEAGRFYVFDEKEAIIPLIPSHFGHLLPMLSREQAEGGTLVCRFAQNNENLLYGEPVALITDDEVIRFT